MRVHSKGTEPLALETSIFKISSGCVQDPDKCDWSDQQRCGTSLVMHSMNVAGQAGSSVYQLSSTN